MFGVELTVHSSEDHFYHFMPTSISFSDDSFIVEENEFSYPFSLTGVRDLDLFIVNYGPETDDYPDYDDREDGPWDPDFIEDSLYPDNSLDQHDDQNLPF